MELFNSTDKLQCSYDIYMIKNALICFEYFSEWREYSHFLTSLRLFIVH
jgi:hypothetical protein